MERITHKVIKRFVEKHNIPVKDKEGERIEGGSMIVLDTCPFNSEHKREAKIFLWDDGSVAFRCKHDSCGKYHLSDFIKHFEPDFYQDKSKMKSIQRGSPKAAPLPKAVSYSDVVRQGLPELAPEMIEGILRKGHKMLLSGQSKAGKSFALIELAVSLATGRTWFGFRCCKTRVLYLNLEVDKDSFFHRVHNVMQKQGLDDQAVKDNLLILNLRGTGATISELVEPVKEYADTCGAVIVDPIYKVLEGDENSASDMGLFTKKLDAIAEGGASLIFCHHFGKATQTQYKDSFSRASGSGVFARDPDAIVSMSGLDKAVVTYEMRTQASVSGNAEPFQLDFTLREFPPTKPLKVWFDYPVHVLDNGALDGISVDNGRRAKDGRTARRIAVLSRAFKAYEDQAEEDGGIPLKILAGRVEGINGGHVDEKQIRNYAKDSGGMFECRNGKLYELKQIAAEGTEGNIPEISYDLHNLTLNPIR